MKKKKSIVTNIILILVLVAGLSLLLYPTFSDWWNSRVQSRAVSNYAQLVSVMDQEDYTHMWEEAKAFNEELLERKNIYLLSEEQQEKYEQIFNLDGQGIMGYIELPTLSQTMPVYHGTEEDVLQIAVGHLEWTSLPTGGAGNHSVFSGHRGLPSAKLFTDLDKLVVGDVFMLHILEETLTYEVDQIRIVEPNVTEDLLPQEGKDLCTLVTCTPYGVNSHRLLVRGHRVDNLAEAQTVRVTADAMVIEKMVVVPFVLVPILLCMLVILLVVTSKKKK